MAPTAPTKETESAKKSSSENQKSKKKEIGIRGKGINSQAREVIRNVMRFMKKEAETGVVIPITNYRMRVMAATGIGKSMYGKIMKEGEMLDHEEKEILTITTPSILESLLKQEMIEKTTDPLDVNNEIVEID